MNAEQIIQLKNAQPFQPFRIVINDGRAFDVRFPDALWVIGDTVMYFRKRQPGPLCDGVDYLGLEIIDRMETGGRTMTQPTAA
jgi:hypothetical protein